MRQILYELFDLLEQQYEGAMSPEEKEAIDRAAPWAKRLEEIAQGPVEFDGIWGSAIAIGQAEEPVWFARGFCLGARLMLEVLDAPEGFPQKR